MEVFIRKPDNICAAKVSEGGEYVYNNGTNVFGVVGPQGLEGSCRLEFPEGSCLEGVFQDGSILSAEAKYPPGVKVTAQFSQLSQTKESYLKNFLVCFESGWTVKGNCSQDGEVESAKVFSPAGRLEAETRGLPLKHKVSDSPETFIVISSIWVYEGGLVAESREDLRDGSTVFEGCGVQIWMRGIGYHRFETANGLVKKTIFRYSRNLELFREAIYCNNTLVKSLSCYGNGVMFATKGDYFSGELIFLLPNNQVRGFECQMDEYWFLKSGVLFPGGDPEKAAVTFRRKNRRLVFCFDGAELDFAEFVQILQQQTEN